MTSSPALLPSPPESRRHGRARWLAAALCAGAGAAVFQFFGNANQGYIDTTSLFWWWIFQWINPASETQHGWLMLGLSAWLLWRNGREAGAEQAGTQACRYDDLAQASRPVAALIAMAAGLALHAVGFAAQQARLSIVALLIFAWGVLRLAGGPRWGRAAVFPLGFLLFAVPITVLDSLGFWLRLWVIDASTGVAHGAGLDVVQSGTQLMAPDGRYNYDVAAACSGVRSLMALAALSLLVGYLNFRGPWRRAVVAFLCLPLVYVGNVARIVAIVFAAQLGGPRWGDVAHEVMGYVIFVIVLGGVLAASVLIQRWWPETEDGGRTTEDRGRKTEGGGRGTDDGRRTTEDRGQEAVDRGQETGDQGQGGRIVSLALPATFRPSGGSGERQRDDASVARSLTTVAASASEWGIVWMVAALVIALAGAEAGFLHWLAKQPARGRVGVYLTADGRNPVELPAFLGRDWVGWPAPVTSVEKDILPPDTGYSRMNYVSSRGARPVFLSIVLSGRDRTSIHRPELCLVGQGWTIHGAFEHRFAFPRPDQGPGTRDQGPGAHGDLGFPATVLRVTRQSVAPPGSAGGPPASGRESQPVPQLVVYWFVGGDQVVATHWERVLADATNRVLRGRADRWAYVLMQTEATDGEAAALQRLQSVLNGTLPGFQKVEGRKQKEESTRR